MEEFTTIQLRVPKEFNFNLDMHIAKLSKMNSKISKEKLILKLAMIGFIQEDENLTEYLK